MNLKKTLVLALFVVALGLYVKYFELPREEQKQRSQELLQGLTRENLKTIQIISPNSDFKLLNSQPKEDKTQNEKSNPVADSSLSWELADVRGSKLDSASLNGLLAALEQLRLDTSIPKSDLSSDMKVYGLDKPALTIKVEHAKGQIELSLGKQNEYISKRYLKVSGSDDLYLQGEGLYTAANKTKQDFRDKTPLEYVDSDLSGITLKDPSNQVKFEALPRGDWKITEPIQKDASASAISELNRNLRNLSAAGFIDESPLPLQQNKLDPADLSVLLDFKPDLKRAPLEIRLSSKKEKVGEVEVESAYMYLKDGASIYKLSENPLSKLIKPIDAWREKRFFKFASDQVRQVDFQLEDSSQLSLVKSGENWLVNGKPGDAVFVLGILRNLSELEALEFPLENRDFGFSIPTLKALVGFSAGAADQSPKDKTLVIGAPVEDAKSGASRYYAGVDDLSEVFIINKESLERIKPKEETLLKLTPEPAKATPTPSQP